MSITGVTNDHASAYGGRGSTRSSAGTASIHHGSGVRSCNSSVPRRMATPSASCAASRANSSYAALPQAVTLSCGKGEVGVPDRGRHARRRLQGQVAGQHVDAVAGLEQAQRAAEPDDSRADDDDPPGPACGRVCRTR